MPAIAYAIAYAYAIAKIAFVTGRIKAYLTFIHVVVRFGDY